MNCTPSLNRRFADYDDNSIDDDFDVERWTFESRLPHQGVDQRVPRPGPSSTALTS